MIDLTVLILTFNERENIGRALEMLRWAPRIIVLDSFSTDETCEIARAYSNVEVLKHAFETFADQCNFGLTQIASDWVLSLDADYLLTDNLISEIRELSDQPGVSGYRARFHYCIHGEPLRRTLLPPRTILYRRSEATYCNEGHGHRVGIDGKIAQLNGYILHDDRKPLSRWFESQSRYSTVEAQHLLKNESSELSVADRIRKLILPAPFLILAYTLFGQLLIFDGWRGWYYVIQRTIAELMLSLRLLEAKLGK